MSRNVKSALVNEGLFSKHKIPSRTIPSHSELRGGRGTRTHKSLRTTVFKTVRLPISVALRLKPKGSRAAPAAQPEG
jgi:hypothetical protein